MQQRLPHKEHNIFCFDVETLGIESTSVVLSAAIIQWEPDEDFTYQELLDRALFVKFDAREQIAHYKRAMDQSTLQWWSKQPPITKKKSLDPSPDDLSVATGMSKLRGYVKNSTSKNKIVWVRGSLDQLVIDSLTRVAEVEDLTHFSMYRDVRTSIDLLCSTAKNGYCTIPGFDRDQVVKHDPVHDCAYDIMMMRYGE